MSSTYELFMSDSIYTWDNNKEVRKHSLDIVFSYPQLRHDNVLHKWEYYSPYNFPSDKFLYEYCYEQLFFIRSLFYTYAKYTKTSNTTLLSATLSKITDITNKYFADKRIYIPGSLSINENYYYISRGNGKSLRELLSFTETFTDYSSSAKFTPYPYVYSLLPYSKEYKVHNYKIDMKNLYSEIIYKKLISSHLTNNSHKQRNNIQEEMSCLKIIADKNNTIRKFHK